MADCTYAGRTLRALPAAITWITRLRSNAALCQLAPLAELATTATFTATPVHRYGTPPPCRPPC